ncbi:hypothetical protein TWF192_007141 [Orbilia oligospora]|nr:hypothetical protein TWF191_000317 [Orbilia oligospora]KAF3262466.1 hypothetical protein TWF192_007141 [Orbilia oligospora]
MLGVGTQGVQDYSLAPSSYGSDGDDDGDSDGDGRGDDGDDNNDTVKIVPVGKQTKIEIEAGTK